MFQKREQTLTAGKIQESQLHMATRMDRLSNHSRIEVIDGQRLQVSYVSLAGCYLCGKSEFEILDGVGGEKCKAPKAPREGETVDSTN
jgi:hypothetical protein